jgi:hypothetical protein
MLSTIAFCKSTIACVGRLLPASVKHPNTGRLFLLFTDFHGDYIRRDDCLLGTYDRAGAML